MHGTQKGQQQHKKLHNQKDPKGTLGKTDHHQPQ